MNTQAFRNNIDKAHRSGAGILPNGTLFDLDSFRTRRNNNVVILGASGAGKTRSYVIPNLLSAVGSYIIADPKGNLYAQYADYMRARGYQVRHIDLIHPFDSDKYNPMLYVHNSDDAAKLANQIVSLGYKGVTSSADPFWEQAAAMLLTAMFALVTEDCPLVERSISSIADIIARIRLNDDDDCPIENSELDEIFWRHANRYSGTHFHQSWAYRQYLKFKSTPAKTLACILITLQTMLGTFDTGGLRIMTGSAESIDMLTIGAEKTVVFLEISDTDRSKDLLANIFYSQAMNELCRYADDECPNSRLPVGVRFILDDFGTNCRIHGFESMISNIRSRNISASLILQSEAQLRDGYGESAHTILDNCDTIVYMGGNDIVTAKAISERCNQPLRKVLNMPIGTNWIFRRGEEPQYAESVDLSAYKQAEVKGVAGKSAH